MTKVDFHSNVPDKLHYACRLVRKAVGAGQRVMVTGGPDMLARFDALLWSFSALEFIPHCAVDSPLASRTPVVLAVDAAAAPHHEVLVNLGADVPGHFARFARLLEIVGAGPDEVAAGRQRYREYKNRGYPLVHHDAGAAGPA